MLRGAFVDASETRTQRINEPLQIRKFKGELTLVAHCHLRNDRRTFKLDRIVRMQRLDMPPLVIPPMAKKRSAAKIYDALDDGARIYDAPEPIILTSLSLDLDLPMEKEEPKSEVACDLTITPNPS